MARTKKPPRLVDIMIKPPYPGDHVAISSIMDEEVVITSFHYIPSQFEDRLDYLAIEIERDGKRAWFTSSSSFIINFFERVSQDILPCRCVFSVIKDEKGDRSYTVR